MPYRRKKKTLDYANMILIDLLAATRGVSLCFLTAVIDKPLEIASAIISQVFLVNNGMVKVGQIRRTQ